MLDYLKSETNMTYTENGAVTHESTLSACLDFFSTVGALRQQSEAEIVKRFAAAWCEDRDLAMKILFYARDIRGGLGERRTFRVILTWLAGNAPETLHKNLPCIAEYGRWDDLLVLLNTKSAEEAAAVLKTQFEADLAALESGHPVSLLGKWLPSVNASSRETVKQAKYLARTFGISDGAYRKALTALRRQIQIIENNIRERDYTFDYQVQPSRAMLKYRKAFLRNDPKRFLTFLNQVETGEAKINTGTLMPYDIVRPILGAGGGWRRKEEETMSMEERRSLDVSWKNLPDFCGGRQEDALVVLDGSSSMYMQPGTPRPADVAQSLAIYFAERNRGRFAGHFITFSDTPKLVEIKGADIYEKVQYCRQFDDVCSTNLEAVFHLLLHTAVKNGLAQSDMPQTLYIISDMEFNMACDRADLTVFENAKLAFARWGLKLPKVVFWNVASRRMQTPVTGNEQGAVLVSGFTPAVFAMVMSGDVTPYRYMMDVLGRTRYETIAA